MSDLPDGIHPTLPMADYRKLEAWGSSSLKAMRVGPPAMVPWERDNPRPETDATLVGHTAHCRILTPDLFDAGYAMKPKGMTFSSTVGKEWRDDPIRKGKTIVDASDAETVEGVLAAFQSKRLAAESLDGSMREVSLLWTDPETGERCKGRPDWMKDGWIYDLKISRHAGARVEIMAYVEGWMHQGSHYNYGARVLGMEPKGVRLVVIGPKVPQKFRVYCVEVKQATLDMLGFDNGAALKRLRECRESGIWPSTPDSWEKIEAPAAALAAMVNMVEIEEV